jgi:uncharacterized metal-binding protein YceD (DUF177 family)
MRPPKFKKEKPDDPAICLAAQRFQPALAPKETPMTDSPSFSYRTGALSHRKPTRFRMVPDAALRAQIAVALDLQAITSLIMEGEILPKGREDFRLQAVLKADVVQSCVVTLAPVSAQIEEDVTRRYLADFSLPDGEEVEIPEDDSSEPLPDVIDLWDVLREALALALPLYPRAAGAELGEAVFAAPGTAPLRDTDLRPFAALAALARKDDTPPE